MPALRKTKSQTREAYLTSLFKSALVKKGWTAGHLAKLLGKTTSCVCKQINNPMNCTLNTLYEIADKLGVTAKFELKWEEV